MFKPLLLLVVVIVVAVQLTCIVVGLPSCNRTCDRCGSMRVPYPLSTDSSCGNTSYAIRCINKKLYFDSANNTYLITNIHPSDQRLTIQPSTLISDTCDATDLSKNGLQLKDGGLFNITSSNTIFYAHCSDSIFGSPLDCSSNNLCHRYINATLGANAPCVNTTCCAFKAGGSTTAYRIRLAESRCRAYMSFVNLDQNLPATDWTSRSGVELQWVSPPKSSCVRRRG